MADAIVLNAAKDLQNVVKSDDFVNITKDTFNQLTVQLLDISGPYARNAFILFNPSMQISNAVSTVRGIKLFTRDGRHTLQNIEYASPIQRYIKDDVLCFVGEKVDDACHDGTTSSMLFTSSFISSLIENRDKLSIYSENEITTAYNSITKTLLEKLDTFVTITKEQFFVDGKFNTPNEAVKEFAYLQAYTSSSCNKEVAEAIATVVSSTPEEIWNYALVQKFPLRETDTFHVEAKKEEYQASFEVNFLTRQYNNIDMGAAYKHNDVDIIVLRSGLFPNGVLYKRLLHYLNEVVDPSAKTLILIPGTQSTSRNIEMFLSDIMSVTTANPDKHIAIAAYDLYAQNTGCLYALDAMVAKANIPMLVDEVVETILDTGNDFDITKYLVHAKTVEIKSNWLNIDGILPAIPETIDVSTIPNNINPCEMYPEVFTEYAWYKEYLLDKLDKEERAFQKNTQLIKDIKRGLALMTVVYPMVISITGKEHDQQMIAHVIDDAAGATLVALKHGLMLNGAHKLHVIAKKEKVALDQHYPDTKTNVLYKLIMDAFIRASYDMSVSVLGKHLNSTDVHSVEFTGRYKYINVQENFNKVENRAVAYTWEPKVNNLLEVKDDATDISMTLSNYIVEKEEEFKHIAPPCQTAKLFDTLFTRIREVGLRFALISYVVVPGTIWDDKRDK